MAFCTTRHLICTHHLLSSTLFPPFPTSPPWYFLYITLFPFVSQLTYFYISFQSAILCYCLSWYGCAAGSTQTLCGVTCIISCFQFFSKPVSIYFILCPVNAVVLFLTCFWPLHSMLCKEQPLSRSLHVYTHYVSVTYALLYNRFVIYVPIHCHLTLLFHHCFHGLLIDVALVLL